MLMLLYQ